MASARGLTPLPPEREAALSGIYAQATASARRRTLAGLAIVAGLAVLAGFAAEVRPLVFAKNIGKFTAYIYEILPPIGLDHPIADVRAWYWGLPSWLGLLGETLLMAYLGTLLGGWRASSSASWRPPTSCGRAGCGSAPSASWRCAAPSPRWCSP